MARTGNDVTEAARLLRSGELVAIPTETVYGLAAHGLDEQAILAIFKVKNRPSFDPLILHTDSLTKVADLVLQVPDQARELARRFWPGPLTLLLDRKPQIPDLVCSGLPRVAVRVPDHPLTLALLQQLDFPLAAPSANPFGYVSPTRAGHVNDQLGRQIPYILDGGVCRVGMESTIVGFENGQSVVYRLGGLQVEQLEAVLGAVRIQLNQSSNPAAPGMIKSHYAPSKPVLIGNIAELLQVHAGCRIGVIAWQDRYPATACEEQIQLSPQGSLEQAGARLFAALRQMDQSPVELIVTERFPEQGLGRAINDRLRRASQR